MDRTKYLADSSAVICAATKDERVSCVAARPAAMASSAAVTACSLAFVAIRDSVAIVAGIEVEDTARGAGLEL